MHILNSENLLVINDSNKYEFSKYYENSKVYFNCENILEEEYFNEILLACILNSKASEIEENLYVRLCLDTYDYPLFDFFQIARKESTTFIRFNLSIEAIYWNYEQSPNKYIKELKAELINSNEYISINSWVEDPDIYITFHKKINEDTYIKDAVDRIFKILIKFHKKIISESSIKILCEGKTDYLHIETALKYFNERNEFINLPIILCKDSVISGDGELLAYCKVASKVSNPNPIICIFDDDNLNITKSISKNTNGNLYKYWKNNVYSVVMPRPHHRKNDAKFCIELYYSDEVLNYKDNKERKIFLKKDFDEKNGFHYEENIICLYPKKGSLIVDSDVIDIRKKYNVALSKNDFANYIKNGIKPFNDVSFKSFRPLFKVIESICQKTIKT